MTGWLTGHIITEDLAIVGKNLSKKIYEPSSKLSIVAKAVNNAMVDVFQVEAKLVQTSYKGQNIGNSLYCRLTYDIDPSLMGGVRVELDGSILDGTLKHRLHEVKEVMNR